MADRAKLIADLKRRMSVAEGAQKSGVQISIDSAREIVKALESADA